MKIKKIIILLTLIIFQTGILFSENNAGRAVFIKGDVEYSINGKLWQSLKLLQSLPEGACVKVGSNSEAALILKDRSQIRLKAGSIFCIKKSGSAPEEKKFKKGILKLIKGSLWFRNKRNTPKPVIETPVVTASIRGTEMAINVNENKNTEIVVLEGKVLCFNEKNKALIKRGEGVKVNKSKKIEIVKLIKPENSVQWLLITPDIVGPADKNVKGIDKEAIDIAKKSIKLLVNNEPEKALIEIKKAIELSPNRAAVNVAMATILQSYGKFKKALKFSKKALTIDKKSIPALLRTVELYLGLNKIKNAEKLISNFKGNKKDARIYLLSGYINLLKYDAEAAINNFKYAITLKPDFSDAYLGLGLAEYYNGKIKKGLKYMEYACLLNPIAAYPHYYLGKAIYGIGERKNAEIEFKRAIQLDKNDPTPYLYLSTLYTDTFRPGKGIIAIQKAIKLNNNRLATRSRYLLDADRATKNVSLSWALAMMGLNEWAKAIGDEAIWNNPADSGAYLFRASEAVTQQAVSPETLSDIKKARLLQPVNSNTFITYTDYQGLLEKPDFKSSLAVYGGNDKTFKTNGFFEGGKRNLAFYIDGEYSTTDGPKDNTGVWGENGLFRSKYAINENHEILFEGVLGHSHEQDQKVWIYGDKSSKDIVNKKNYWSLIGGYHWKQNGMNNLILSFQFNGNDGNYNIKSQSKLKDLYHNRSFRGEFVEFLNFNSHKLSIGGSIEYGYNFDTIKVTYKNLFRKSSSRNYKREHKFFVRDLFHLTDTLIIDYGFSICRQDGYWIDRNLDAKEKDRFLPHLGIIKKFRKNTIRIGFYQELQSNYSSGSLQPAEVAGFKKITGVWPGSWIRFYGAGIDRKWNLKNFTRLEFLRYEKRLANGYNPNPYSLLTWEDERDNILRLTHEILITEELALSVTGRIKSIKTRNGSVTRRTDRDLFTKLTYVRPDGLIIATSLWVVDQNTGKGYKDFHGDSFEIFSLSLKKSFMNKKGEFYLDWENIFDKEYRYLMFEPIEANQLPWQNSRVIVGLRWNF